MNWQLLVPLLVTTVVAIAGWYIAHAFASKRDRTKKQRDLRVEYLIQAYRRLGGCSNRDKDTFKAADLESALAEIQLLGSLGQIELAQKFSNAFPTAERIGVDDLLADLRAEMRKELQLKQAPKNISYLRVIQGKQDSV